MIGINIDTSGLLAMEKALLKLASEHLPTALAKTLTRLATGARRDVMERMEHLFDKPIPFTTNSIRYEMATRERPMASVYISDDAAKGLSPRKYLQPEIEGGGRRLKRSERALIAAGLMQPDQHIIPAEHFELDAFGNVPGPIMVQILSRLRAFGESGYRANASARTLKRLKKAGLASHRTSATEWGGSNYFVAKSRRGGEPLGIYQLLGKGKVQMAFYFARRNPSYAVRFPFEQLVKTYADANFPREMMLAVNQEIAKHG